MPVKNSPTQIVVGTLIGLVLCVVFYNLLGWKLALGACGLLLYEAYTLINRFPEDTISEIIWVFSKRPMVPWLFGLGTAYAIASGLLPATQESLWISLALGFLSGHFFFQRHEESNNGVS